MDELTAKVIATGLIVIGGTGMTFARRWKNTDSTAGLGVAGWTVVILLFMWT